MRGKHLQAGRDICKIRITPAGAGKTVKEPFLLSRIEDHPRRCGENLYEFRVREYYAGSPPQVRGKRSQCKSFSLLSRITPAGAGKTIRRIRSLANTEDHPRRCGENLRFYHTSRGILGSPPQVRGKLYNFAVIGDCGRITPAGAGKTPYLIYMCRDSEDHPRRCGENLPLNVN